MEQTKAKLIASQRAAGMAAPKVMAPQFSVSQAAPQMMAPQIKESTGYQMPTTTIAKGPVQKILRTNGTILEQPVKNSAIKKGGKRTKKVKKAKKFKRMTRK